MNLEDEAPQRRRGAVLEAALLDATWEELMETGYADLTIDAVARRAGTSRPVLYRRWATKADLVEAAVRHRIGRGRPTRSPDTGTLRGDLLAIMRQANRDRASVALLTFKLGSYFEETGTSPATLRDTMFGDRPTLVDVVLDRAVDRGEIDPDRLTPRLRSLPFDLYRHEVLVTLRPVPERVMAGLVDEVLLPLLTRPA